MPLDNYITLSQLTKSVKGLVNKINGEATVINGKIGNLTNLNTSAKTDLVAAINEAAASSGGSGTTQVNADWNATSGVAQILNKPTIPNVPSWALEATKPTYTASEVGALPSTYTAPVTSVNGQTGVVNLIIPAAQVQSDWNATSGMGVILNKPTIPAATTVTQTLTSGTKIGEVNGTSLYAPAQSSVSISNTLTSGTLIATINGTNIYAPSYTDADGVSY